MAKFVYNHKHVKHLVLQGEKDKEPYAVFLHSKFETDDPKVIERLQGYPGVKEVEKFPDEEEPDADDEGAGE